MPRKNKAKAEVQRLDPKRHREIKLDPKLIARTVTARSLSSGKYQKQILAFFAKHATPVLFNGLIAEAKTGNVQAMKILAEIYNFTPKGAGGVNILVQQNNQQNNSRRPVEDDDGAMMSFEDIARIVSDRRQKLLGMSPSVPSIPSAIDAQFEATPPDESEGE